MIAEAQRREMANAMASTLCRGFLSSFVADSGNDITLLNLLLPNESSKNSCKFLNRSCPLTPCHSRCTVSKSSSVLVKAAASEEIFRMEEKEVEKPQKEEEEDNGLFKAQVESLLETIKWDEKGLVVAIAQHIDTGAILMQGFANKDAVSRTLTSRKATFYSRSRSSLWTKGETSSNFINVSNIFMDCDRDSIIYLGEPDGPTCHTGAETCYFTAASDFFKTPQVETKRLPMTSLYSLENTISQRQLDVVGGHGGKPSWTKRLLEDQKLLCSKIREEASELCHTLEDNEDKSRTASEMADVLYHAMVLLAVKNVKIEEVLEILRARFGQSGIEEKNSRKSNH